MSTRLIERIEQCPDCKFTKLKLHVCRQCQTFLLSTVLDRTARCPKCRQWLTVEKEVKVREMSGFTEWYEVQSQVDFEFICEGFTRHRKGLMDALRKRSQLTLEGFERR